MNVIPMSENRIVCECCGREVRNELVDICHYGYGDNVREYMNCPKCGHAQRIFPADSVITTASCER
jgi:ribosomal protein S27E